LWYTEGQIHHSWLERPGVTDALADKKPLLTLS
jgi:hypothetical protein